MGTSAEDGTVVVRLSTLIDVAVEAWRIRSSVEDERNQNSTAAAKYGSRRIADIAKSLGLEIIDLTGQNYEPGLAVEVIGRVSSRSPPEAEIIHEMITPICLWEGRVVRHGQVIIRTNQPTACSEQVR